MQDPQIEKFFAAHGFVDAGLLSFEKPKQRRTLSTVVVTDSAPPQYYLSAKACAGIIRRSVERKKPLPPELHAALTLAITDPLLKR